MLTRCPQCFAWFRLRAEHLSLAKGLVTCGRCEHVFNALESLVEEAPAAPAPPRFETPVEPAPVTATPVAPPSPPPPAAPEPLRFVTVSATTTLAPAATPASPSTPSHGPALAAPLASSPAVEAPVAPPAAAPLSFVTLTAQASLTPRTDSVPLTVTTGAARATALTALAGVTPIAPDSPPPVPAQVAAQANTADDEDLALDALPSFAPDADFALDAAPLPMPHDTDFDLADSPPVAMFDEFDVAPPPPPPEEDFDIGPVSRRDDEVDISDFDFSAVDEPAAPPPDEHDAEPGDDTDPHALAHLREASVSAPALRPLPLDPDYVPPHVPDDDETRDDTDPQALARRAAASEPAAGATPMAAVDGGDADAPLVMNEVGVPAVLAADLAALAAPPRASSWRALLWAGFAFVLALGALLQAAFMERQAVVAALPEAGAVIDALCARLPCLERRAQTPTVRLLARDVREHPSYRDALLVNATIMNDGKTPTPYPVIDLRLRDAAGNVLSARRFEPREYLDQSIAVDEGMPPERPVYIVLELAGNASNAVSFEFTFL
ncbi:MAG: zinc-ribbon and DUF3426 domain-containing protein [Gammaproteobacteria bacterium]